MAKFNVKAIAKNAGKNSIELLALGGGVIATQKFLDFKTLFPNVDPNKVWMKHEGVVKILGAIVTLSMFEKMPSWAKALIMGVAVQGFIKEVRVLTMNAEGESFVKQIGDGDYNQQIQDLAEEIKAAGMSGEDPTGQGYSAVAGITDQGYSAVAGANDGRANTVMLNQNSQTGVAGMGMEDIE